MPAELTPDPKLVARFAADLEALVGSADRLGLAVSGGPDSLALLLLAAASRSDVVAATIDHGLRAANLEEAQVIANVCRRLGVPHRILSVKLEIGSSLQAKARDARYAALAEWARESRAKVLLTAHHIDDQAETVLMRLARGAGLGGLAGVRATRPLGPDLNLARPLLGWRKDELRRIVEQAGLEAADDPSNADPRHDRTAMRALLANQSRLDPERLAASAQHLLQAEDALAWTAQRLASERLAEQGLSLTIDAGGLPDELARRLLLIAFDRLKAPPPRGPDLVRAVVTLRAGGSCTLSEVQLGGGELWTLGPAPPRRSRKK